MSDADPHPDPRRSEALFRQLQQRAQTWLPNWQGIAARADATARADFGRAFLQIAARVNAEVTQRLDQTPNKAALGMLDWLAIAARPGNAARMPVVLKARANGKQNVFAKAPLKFQVNTKDAPIPFESKLDIRVVPGSLIRAFALDTQVDALYLPPPSLLRIEAPSSLPTRWIIKSVVGENEVYDKLQLDPPELGLDADLWLQIGDAQYRIAEKAQGGLVKIDPALPLDNMPQVGETVRLVQVFEPFPEQARNLQAHYLYIGDENALNLVAPTLIDLVGGQALYDKCSWSYWGKANSQAEPTWLPLTASLLDDGADDTLRLNKSDSGSAEIVEVAGRKSRWLRALADPAQIGSSALSLDGLSLRMQSASQSEQAMPVLEAVSNTTSVVLNERFYPFGKTPRQFDVFCLACKEVFSKSGAKVTLTATIAGRTLGPIIGWLGDGYSAVAAVAQDGVLYVLHGELVTSSTTGSLPSLSWQTAVSAILGGATASSESAEAAAQFKGFSAQFAPLKIRLNETGRALYLAAGKQVWRWDEPSSSGSKWVWQGNPAPEMDVLHLALTGREHNAQNASLLALSSDGKSLYSRPILQNDTTWRAVTGLDDSQWTRVLALHQLTDASGEPFASAERALLWSADARTVGVLGVENNQWQLRGKFACPSNWFNSSSDAGNCTPLAWQWQDDDQDCFYLAVVLPGAGSADDKIGLAMWHGLDGDLDAPPEALFEYAIECGGKVIGDAPNLAFSSDDFAYQSTPIWLLCSVRLLGGSVQPMWFAVPKQANAANPNMQSDSALLPSSVGQQAILLDQQLIVPGNAEDLMSIAFAPLAALTLSEAAHRVGNGLLPDQAIDPCDWIQWDTQRARLRAYDSTAPLVAAGRPWVLGPTAASQRRANMFNLEQDDFLYDGELIAANCLQIALQEIPPVAEFNLILTSKSGDARAYLVRVKEVKNTFVGELNAYHELKLDVPLINQDGELETGQWSAWQVDVESAPSFDYTPRAGIWSATSNSDLSADGANPTVLRDSSEAAEPVEQSVASLHAQSTSIGGQLILLGQEWSVLPAPDAQEMVNFSYEADANRSWSRYAPALNAAPDLSWEYWNGNGWWQIANLDDRTGDFRQSGEISFVVPDDIGQTEVLGRQNFWIRARLVGGDYGRESFSVIATAINAGSLAGTDVGGGAVSKAISSAVKFSNEDIHAPQIVSLKIFYELEQAIWPQTVLTQDSFSWLEQSLANRSPGAFVSVFTPLEQRLIAFGAQQVGRSLFLALQNKPESGPVRIFFKVDEMDLSVCAPLKVEALADGRFVPVLADDDTRALGENGLLTLQFDQSPSQAELFGHTAYWLRLYPSQQNDVWTPALRGAYLNAVWAEAAQQRSMDILGSSDASPNQSVTLQGAPVLAHSLELRVRETLGSEERAALLAAGCLVSDPPSFPGDWVLWQEVADPADEVGDARVYALDAGSGVIRFGDGKHGAVPPLGRNNIVAFAWRRGGGAQANGLAAFTAVNLVGPIEGVEGAFNPEIAVGGAEPEQAAEVALYAPARLRMRQRIITLRDLEQAAFDFSDEWVQAHALQRGNRVALVGVARGENPVPGQAQRRALADYLAAHADPLLVARVDVRGPRLWPFALALSLTVPSLDATGAVGSKVEAALARWFDSACGGADGRGIGLGAPIEADDIAYALLAIDDLENLTQINVQVMNADHQIVAELPRAVLPDDALPRLIALNLQFTVSAATGAA